MGGDREIRREKVHPHGTTQNQVSWRKKSEDNNFDSHDHSWMDHAA